ncbi:hypothetical protein F7725_005857 [Dissostichus mawsoni]|uniref:Uncharacterized protein n=1 Tax=Dissostichus mawsoni TaxID=36200 RepID=A0A7J5YSF2_DISMA|nr:hypothetical protein F7725_005857 [Dissostichus mawsoni]
MPPPPALHPSSLRLPRVSGHSEVRTSAAATLLEQRLYCSLTLSANPPLLPSIPREKGAMLARAGGLSWMVALNYSSSLSWHGLLPVLMTTHSCCPEGLQDRVSQHQTLKTPPRPSAQTTQNMFRMASNENSHPLPDRTSSIHPAQDGGARQSISSCCYRGMFLAPRLIRGRPPHHQACEGQGAGMGLSRQVDITGSFARTPSHILSSWKSGVEADVSAPADGQASVPAAVDRTGPLAWQRWARQT